MADIMDIEEDTVAKSCPGCDRCDECWLLELQPLPREIRKATEKRIMKRRLQRFHQYQPAAATIDESWYRELQPRPGETEEDTEKRIRKRRLEKFKKYQVLGPFSDDEDTPEAEPIDVTEGAPMEPQEGIDDVDEIAPEEARLANSDHVLGELSADELEGVEGHEDTPEREPASFPSRVPAKRPASEFEKDEDELGLLLGSMNVMGDLDHLENPESTVRDYLTRLDLLNPEQPEIQKLARRLDVALEEKDAAGAKNFSHGAITDMRMAELADQTSTEFPAENDQNGLRDWLARSGFATNDDLRLHKDKGRVIEAPRLQLIRAKHFLACENANSCADWDQKLAALGEYLNHLARNCAGEDWTFDLKMALGMLKAHHLMGECWNKRTILQLGSPNHLAKANERLPFVRGSIFTVPTDCAPPGKRHIGEQERYSSQIYFEPIQLKWPPSPEESDPNSYIKSALCYEDKTQKWVDGMRDDAISPIELHLQQVDKDSNIISFPQKGNWKGPLSANLLDKRMQELYQNLKDYRELKGRLDRAFHRSAHDTSTRGVLAQTMQYMEAGLKGEVWHNLGLNFGAHEYADEEEKDLAPIRPVELQWLKWICGVDPAEVLIETKDFDHLEQVFLAGIRRLLQDHNPDGIFATARRRAVEILQIAINHGITRPGLAAVPVKHHQFTLDETWKYAQKLAELKLLETVEEADGSRSVGIALPKHFPEEAIRWPGPRPRHISTLSKNIDTDDAANGDDPDDPGATRKRDYERYLPLPSDFAPPHEVLTEPWSEDDKKMTSEYFCQLGYRFGLTIYRMEQGHERNLDLLKDPSYRAAALGILANSLRFWETNHTDRDNRPTAPIYEEVVEASQPRLCILKVKVKMADIVREGIIREVWQNKSMLWHRRSADQVVVDGVFVRRIPDWGREAIWSFGHPANRPMAKRFWDINRWPVHLQTEERQMEIEASGLGSITEPQTNFEQQETPSSSSHLEKNAMLFDGGDFFIGSTPRQRRHFLEKARNKIAESKPPTWKDRLTKFIGRGPDVDENDHRNDTLELPPQSFVPRSRAEYGDGRPRKRRRAVFDDSPVGEQRRQEDIIPLELSIRNQWAHSCKSWMWSGYGFWEWTVPLRLERFEPQEFVFDASPGEMELEKTFAKIGWI